jgi:hypothetical protein
MSTLKNKTAVIIGGTSGTLTDIDALASRVKAECGTFDLLFVNAGFSIPVVGGWSQL